MRKIAVVALACSLLLTGCGAPKIVSGVYHPTYGIFNSDRYEDSKVCYEPSIGNIVLSIIFVETIVVPVYFIGWSIMNPIGSKSPDGSCNAFH